MDIGDECIYRRQDQSPSERVQLVEVQQGKRAFARISSFSTATKQVPMKTYPVTGSEAYGVKRPNTTG